MEEWWSTYGVGWRERSRGRISTCDAVLSVRGEKLRAALMHRANMQPLPHSSHAHTPGLHATMCGGKYARACAALGLASPRTLEPHPPKGDFWFAEGSHRVFWAMGWDFRLPNSGLGFPLPLPPSPAATHWQTARPT
jgi:hypothetical protein